MTRTINKNARRRRRKINKNGCLLSIIATVLILGMLVFGKLSNIKPALVKGEARALPAILDALPSKFPEIPEPSLQSTSAILIDAKNGNILFDKNADVRIWPASLTKMMTIIIAIESLPDLNEKILLPDEVFRGLFEANASMSGFSPGEKVTAIDLLYGAMLPSGAESATGLAARISGSEAAFAEKMNQRAKELGMNGTHFVNATGLHNSEHYSTVRDIGILLQSALKNPTFRTVFTTQAYTSSKTNLHPNGVQMKSTVFSKLPDPSFPGGQLLGGKTGYTGEAGLCLASLGVRNDEEYIVVTTGAPASSYGEPPTILDAKALYQSADQYKRLSRVCTR